MQIRLPGARIVGVVAAIGVLAGGAAYAGTTTSSKVTKVGFASPAKASDYGWNQQGYNAAKAAASRPIASRIGPRLTPSSSESATSCSSAPGCRRSARISSRRKS